MALETLGAVPREVCPEVTAERALRLGRRWPVVEDNGDSLPNGH